MAGVIVRRYADADRAAVMALAPRLGIGVAAWREAGAVGRAVHGWVATALDGHHDPDRAVFVAVAGEDVAGVVSVSQRRHFTGAWDALD